MKRPVALTLMLLAGIIAYCQEKTYPTKSIEPIYGLSLTDAERDSMATNLTNLQKDLEAIHQYKLSNSVPMSLIFDPLPLGFVPETSQKAIDWGLPRDVKLPANKNELAFYPVYKLAVLLKGKKISSVELTRVYLERIQ
jgi:hypothetical protein